LLNTDGCGLPKHVYSREWVWVLQIQYFMVINECSWNPKYELNHPHHHATK
jgi:hypothetical protein